MIFAHIAGIDDLGRELLSKQAKKFLIVDLDEFTDKIVSDKNMNAMFERFEYHQDKAKDVNLTKLQQKQENEKSKTIERKMNVYWKTQMQKHLDVAIKLNTTPIILVGYSTYFKNLRINIDVKTSMKFFQKVHLIEHAKKLVEMNLDNYREEIIEGIFPLEYLNHDTIIKKRDSLMLQYKKMGYQIDTINNILNSIHIASSSALPSKLYYASSEDHTKKLPLTDNRLVAYDEDWVAVVSALTKNNKDIIKGFSGGKPFIKETVADGFKVLEKPVYLYLVQNTNGFTPLATKNKVYKYQAAKQTSFSSKIIINNALTKLKELNVNLVYFN